MATISAKYAKKMIEKKGLNKKSIWSLDEKYDEFQDIMLLNLPEYIYVTL